MKFQLPFDLKIPVIYVNPPLNNDPSIIEEVFASGGLGFIDRVSSPGFNSKGPHGVRISIEDLASFAPDSQCRAYLIPLEQASELGALEAGEFKKLSLPVITEVGNRAHAELAEKAGAAALIARGNEGPGWVAETNGFVLLQEILAASRLPVFLQGGIDFATAAGAMAAGASGIVLDIHFLLTKTSGLSGELKQFFGSLNSPSTVLLAEATGMPLRVYSRLATKKVRDLKVVEDTLLSDQFLSYRDELDQAMKTPVQNPDSDPGLLAFSEDIFLAKNFASRTCESVMDEFGRRMSDFAGKWPFGQDATVCADHVTKYPIVQGPMAHVSDNPDFLAAVAESGALPVLALGNMPEPIAREGIELARQKTNGKFGVGLIGMEVNRRCYEAHLEIMSENPPPFAILAAGSPELAGRVESIGTTCYLHCPSPSILSEAVKAGLRHFVFEGSESGGHVGPLGSLTLWGSNLRILEDAAEKGLALNEVTVLFAGGIATARAAAFVAGMASHLVNKGLKIGLQVGTAYLTTQEAVATCAITPTYQSLTLESNQTVLIGRSVNIRARAAGSPQATTLIQREWDRLRNGVSLKERKELYEKDNLGSLRLASKGCAIDPSTATWDCPVFCDLPPEEQRRRGLYMMGQAACLMEAPTTMESLHEHIFAEGRKIFDENRNRNKLMINKTVENTRPLEIHTEIELKKEPIAVIGIGLHFPDTDSPAQFWDQILSGRSGIRDVPPDRWGNPDHYYNPDPKAPDKTYSRIGGFVDVPFDPLRYRIPPSVAKKMDRTQQLAVMCVADALEDAGLSPELLKGKRVGIIIGNSMGGETTEFYAERVQLPRTVSYLEEALAKMGLSQAKDALIEEFRKRFLEGLPDITEDSLPGELANVISGRVANVFNLEGPNFTVDAACASSIAAVMNACNELREGKIDFAVSGGVDAAMHASSFVKFSKVGALSPDGSRPFDEGANGFVMGEGAGILVLKRLSDAVRDGDRIYGTILEVGSSSDGRGKGITAPNAAGQERAIHSCFNGSAIDPRSIGLIEAHGTSTPVGDSTELGVLDKFFRNVGVAKSKIGIGSVKSQIGHLKAAAGAAGMIKALLALHHKTLPPTINVRRPNPCINWDSSPLFLLTEQREWIPENGYPRRSGVSAFGFGGTNFHMILQEHVPGLKTVSPKAPVIEPVKFVRPDWPKPPNMQQHADAWVIGAGTPKDLESKIDAVLTELSPDSASAIAEKHFEQASAFDLRIAFAAIDSQDAAKKLELIKTAIDDPAKRSFLYAKGIHFAQGKNEKIAAGAAFLFPGQGSQYPFMLRDLAELYPSVAETLAEADEVLQSLGLAKVTSYIFPESDGSDRDHGDAMKDTQILQPMILTANTAIFRLLAKMGLKPVACAGHSLGEYAACVAAGVFSFKDALEAVAVRGREMARVSIADPGLMMSIPADTRLVEEVLAEVDGYVVAANKNSPKQTVISGETEAVKKAGELFKARGLDGILIPVSAAFHSGVVAPAREPFMKTLERLKVNAPQIPVLSNVTGDFYPIGPGAPSSIRDLLGKQFAAPVEWVKTMRRLYADGVRVFVECGPKRVMTNLVLDTLPKDAVALPTNHPKKGGLLQLMEAVAVLASEGIPVNPKAALEPPRPESKRERPRLKVVQPPTRPEPAREIIITKSEGVLDGFLDAELKEMAGKREFARFLELQGEPIRMLIKSGFKTFVKNVLPLDATVRQIESEGMTFQPVVISGLSAGLPSDVRFPFDKENLDDLILGKNFIKKVTENGKRRMLEKNVERLFKGPDGEAGLQVVEDVSGVIKLAGFFNEEEIINEYRLDERIVRAMDITTKLSIAAGLEALRDAGIPLQRQVKTTSTGQQLLDSWTLPPALRNETGIIFASAFPGMASVIDEVTRQTAARYGSDAKNRLINFYTGLVAKIRDDRERERVTKWFTQEFGRLNVEGTEEVYTFNRDFLLRVMSMAHGQLAQLIKAQGPNTHVDAACATTTQAIIMARDWIRTGQARRVLVIAADDVAGKTLLPWIGSGFLSMGAATVNGNVSEAALPFDERRHGLILGSAAAGLVIEAEDLVKQRGMEPIATIEGGIAKNSGFHGTRLDVEHISSVMEEMVSKWEKRSGKTRSELAKDVFFMSHETYSPKRGGSSAAEIKALRGTFGEDAKLIPITNTKGFTGHTMGVGVEDIVALRCLQKGMIPPIPNLRQPDPDFADLNLSTGGKCGASHALRLAAGFGSQIVMALYKLKSNEENRIVDLRGHRSWLKDITDYTDPIISVQDRTLRVAERVQQDRKTEPVIPAPKVNEREPKPATADAVQPVRDKILQLLSSKTGYPADMLDTGLDLEADLGIDTVKQAEFISEIREAFNIPRIDGLKIAEFPTIEHIIKFVLDHSQKPSADSETGKVSKPETNLNSDEVKEKLLSLLSEKTGYPAEMLDTGLDLEADLGIDTVKQAEFISEVREAFNIPRIDGLKIAEFPTIDHIIRFVLEHTQKPSAHDGTVPESQHSASLDDAEVKEKILSLLSEKTGYPPDMLDADLDLEADLGIDTVKQAEFISEVREAFDIPRIDGLKIAEFPTINHIVMFVMEKTATEAASTPATHSPKSEPADEPAPQRQADIRLYEARLTPVPTVESISLPAADRVLVMGGPDSTADKVSDSLKELGYIDVERVSEPEIPEKLAGTEIGIVNLFNLEKTEDSANRTFRLYLDCAKSFDSGPEFLITAVSEDGGFGFVEPSTDGYLAGMISGATKAFAREFSHTHVRVLDLHPSLSADDMAEALTGSLKENFPLEVGVSEDGRIRSVRLVPALDSSDEPAVNSGDVILVTGGARGITAECLAQLAEINSLTFAVLGRTALSARAEALAGFGPDDWNSEKLKIVDRLKRDGKNPTPVMVQKELDALKNEAEVQKNLNRLRSLGSEVLYRSVDVTDGSAVDKAVAEIARLCDRIDVVIHAAGIDVSRALKSKTLEQIEKVVSVKVQGMQNVLEALERNETPPRRIVGFGSVSGRFGNLAQVDYSAANDGLAHLLRRADKELDARVTIIDWAPWAEVGMAAGGSVQQTLEAAGIDFIPPETGTKILVDELKRNSGSCEVLAAGALGPFASDAFHVPNDSELSEIRFAGQSGRIISIIPGEYLKAKLSLDPKHPLLDHHRIDRAAVVPGVGGLEIMRAGAMMLNPEMGPAKFEQVHFRSPIKVFRSDPFECELEVAKVLEGDKTRYVAKITSYFLDRAGRRLGDARLHHECMISAAGGMPECEPLGQWEESVFVGKEDIYEAFFHGPGFKLLENLLIEGSGKGIKFRYVDTPERSSMFSDHAPAALEAIFQAGAGLGLETRGVMALPIGVENCTIAPIGNTPASGELALVGISSGGPEERMIFRFDAAVRDGEGNVLLFATGIEMMELQSTPGFPGRRFETMISVAGIRKRMELDPVFFKENLTDEEMTEHSRKANPKRAGEWLAGRLAAKRSVERLLNASLENAPTRKAVRITQNESGKPSAELAIKPGECIAEVSISHSGGIALACAAFPGEFRGIGIDIEKIEQRSNSWVEDYFTTDEIRIASKDDSPRILTEIWALKEAFLKAVGVGLRFDLKDINVKSVGETGTAVFELHNEALKQLGEMPPSVLEAGVDGRGDFVIARVALKEPKQGSAE